MSVWSPLERWKLIAAFEKNRIEVKMCRNQLRYVTRRFQWFDLRNNYYYFYAQIENGWNVSSIDTSNSLFLSVRIYNGISILVVHRTEIVRSSYTIASVWYAISTKTYIRFLVRSIKSVGVQLHKVNGRFIKKLSKTSDASPAKFEIEMLFRNFNHSPQYIITPLIISYLYTYLSAMIRRTTLNDLVIT